MKIARLILLILVLGMVIVAAGGVIVYADTMGGPLPQTSGTLSVSGLNAPVEILRDSWGVPHIYASSPHDLYFAQGYAQAQDRWWQMEFYRHTGSGSIEELTGKTDDLVGTDVFIRTVGWRRTAEQEMAQISDEERAPLQAFADGVNAYILHRPADDLALEYRLLAITGVSITVQPWTIADTLVWGKVMAWNLSDTSSYKEMRQTLYDALGAEMAADFTPPWPYGGDFPTILYDEDLPISASSAAQKPAVQTGDAEADKIIFAGGVQPGAFAFSGETGIGSNNWVVTGSMTANGTPLLANDPHLGIQMPSIWYEIGLHCQPVSADCPLNVVGFALSPAPGVIIGHNTKIAWGVTNVGADVMDLYRITINPDNPLQYQWNGAWHDMTVADETVSFGDGAAPLSFQVRLTHLGPIINDNQIDKATGALAGFNNVDPLVLRWTGSDPGTLFTAVSRLNSASNWDEFRAGLSLWDIPAQNFVYADIAGNIGYQTPGRIPIRPADSSGLTPEAATSDADVWQGFIPFDDLPRIFNPARDYIVTANQAVVPMRYYEQLAEKLGSDANYLLSYDWAYGERAQRITELLQQNAPNTIESIQTIQGDNKNVNAELILPYLTRLTGASGHAKQSIDYLASWDFQMDMASGQAALFAEFTARLLHHLFDDQLPDDIEADNHELWSAVQLLAAPENVWWADATTIDTVETRDDILLRALAEAFEATSGRLGSDQAEWQWGKLHTATFVSNPLGASGIDLIERLVNRGPVAASGGSDSVNATSWSPASGNFAVRSLPSMRMIVDVADFDQSVTMHTTGQSGHPSSPHYGDMIESWRTIQYHPMLWSRANVEAAAVDRLILNPASEP